MELEIRYHSCQPMWAPLLHLQCHLVHCHLVSREKWPLYRNILGRVRFYKREVKNHHFFNSLFSLCLEPKCKSQKFLKKKRPLCPEHLNPVAFNHFIPQSVLRIAVSEHFIAYFGFVDHSFRNKSLTFNIYTNCNIFTVLNEV